MDEKQIIHEYVENKKTLRAIAVELGTNHHMIKRILTKNGIPITQKDRVRKPFSDEHRRKISESSKGRTSYWQGKHMPKSTLYKNMCAHIQWEVDLAFLMQFEDIEKLKVLNKVITRDRVSANFDSLKYQKFIEKFYSDPQFISVYEDWLNEGEAAYARPSLDHIIPLSKGGTWDINNLQIIPWCVNRAKYNYLPEEWAYIKGKYFND